MTEGDQRLALRAFDGSGTRRLAGEVSIDAPAQDETFAARVVAAASVALGAPVALLGMDEADAVYLEVLGEGPGAWEDAQLPDGWHDRAPWRQPAWYAEAVARIDRALDEAGCRRTGPAVQTKHWSISALMRVPTDAGDVWFKQVPAMFAHEGRLNAWLAELAPEVMVAPLAVGDDWWLARSLPDALAPDDELAVVEVLADLQQRTASRTDELLALGCPDRRLPVLQSEVAALVEREDGLAEPQRRALAEVLPAFGSLIDRLTALGLPDTLVHGDFHGGNTRFTRRGWSIYDWTDGCVAHPLVDLAPAGFSAGSAVAATDGRLARTIAQWRSTCPALSEESASWGLVVGAAHQLVTYRRIADGVEPGAVAMWTHEGGRWCDQLVELLTTTR